MPERDFQGAYRSLDSAFEQAELSPQAKARLDHALKKARARSARRFWGLAPVLALSAAGATALVLFLAQRPDRSAPSVLSGFELSERSPDLEIRGEPDGTIAVARGGCTLEEPAQAVTARVRGSARVRREAAGVRVLAGRVEFTVAKRPAQAPPATVLVSHGAIEVLGTRFEVAQGEDGGVVTLHEGIIRFRVPDGRLLSLRQGERLSWPVEPPPTAAPPPEPTSPAPPPEPTSPPPAAPQLDKRPPRKPSGLSSLARVSEPQPPQVEALLHRLVGLRARSQYVQATREIEAALSRPLPQRSRELLDFELGSLLTYQLDDPPRACEHWSRFLQRHRTGRFAVEVRQAQEALRCASPP